MINENYFITIINDMQEKNEKKSGNPGCCCEPLKIALNLTVNDSKIPPIWDGPAALILM